MSAVCPSCGVAVVSGYAKCPKCQTPLPYSRRQTVAGGTAVEDRRFPLLAILAPAGALVLFVVLFKVCGSSSSDDSRPVTTTSPATPTTPSVLPQPQTPATALVSPSPAPSAPDTTAATTELDRVLRAKRFWSTIDVANGQVDVRSGSCDDPSMPEVIDGVAGVLRGAGLTRMRCLAQSGTVVFERNL